MLRRQSRTPCLKPNFTGLNLAHPRRARYIQLTDWKVHVPLEPVMQSVYTCLYDTADARQRVRQQTQTIPFMKQLRRMFEGNRPTARPRRRAGFLDRPIELLLTRMQTLSPHEGLLSRRSGPPRLGSSPRELMLVSSISSVHISHPVFCTGLELDGIDSVALTGLRTRIPNYRRLAKLLDGIGSACACARVGYRASGMGARGCLWGD
jgi:hypothetical protein